IYYYDGRQTSAYRLPPHFNKKWMFSDFNGGYIRVATPADDGKSISGDMEFFASGFLSRPLDMEMGPEGALYVLDYDGWFNAGSKTGISRLEYTGTCVDRTLFPAAVSVLRDADRLNGLGQDRLVAADLRSGSLLLPEGVGGVGLYDLKGTLVYSFRKSGAQGAERIAIPAHLRGSLLKARFSN
nr:hypothetical protein [Fibrobacterota bacterium]